jgi:hypothetical protein
MAAWLQSRIGRMVFTFCYAKYNTLCEAKWPMAIIGCILRTFCFAKCSAKCTKDVFLHQIMCSLKDCVKATMRALHDCAKRHKFDL